MTPAYRLALHRRAQRPATTILTPCGVGASPPAQSKLPATFDPGGDVGLRAGRQRGEQRRSETDG
jgi:hypothetical protein